MHTVTQIGSGRPLFTLPGDSFFGAATQMLRRIDVTPLNKAQIENLIHVRDHGKAKPRSRSGYWCRTNGLSQFVWLFQDGAVATTDEKTPCEGAWLEKVVGERLTEAGIAALAAQDGEP